MSCSARDRTAAVLSCIASTWEKEKGRRREKGGGEGGNIKKYIT